MSGLSPVPASPDPTGAVPTLDAYPSFEKMTADAAAAGWQEIATQTGLTVTVIAKLNGNTVAAPYPDNPIAEETTSRTGNNITYQCALDPGATKPSDSYMPRVTGMVKPVGVGALLESLAALGVTDLGIVYASATGGVSNTIESTDPLGGDPAPPSGGSVTVVVYNPS